MRSTFGIVGNGSPAHAHGMTTPQALTPARLYVFWIIWAAILANIVVLQLKLGPGLPHGENAPGAAIPVMAWVAVSEVMIATLIRWFWIPRLDRSGPMLVAMIIGIAVAESAGYFGIFLIPRDQPQTKLLIFCLSVFGILQFAPFYAARCTNLRPSEPRR